MKKTIIFLTALLVTLFFLTSTVSAHDADIQISAGRECGATIEEETLWWATYTVTSPDYDKEWRMNRYVIYEGQQVGMWSGYGNWVDDQMPQGPESFTDIPADVDWVEVTVVIEWRTVGQQEADFIAEPETFKILKTERHACENPTTTTIVEEETATTTTVKATLPKTGTASTVGIVGIAAILLVFGGSLLAIRRRYGKIPGNDSDY